MDRSKLSHVISTTRLLPHFSSTNVDTIKLCIFDQLGIQTESQFVCVALNSLYKALSTEALSIIRIKAIEIGENQIVTDGTSITNTTTRAQQSQQRNTTVYKYIQNQNHNGFCQLHSDIIDYFGTFLSKKQSIEFGYLNKQLFIETQKQSYSLKRCKDKVFQFDSKKCDKMLIGKNDAFNYTFPRSLSLSLPYEHSNIVQKMAYFNNFFRRLSILNCHSYGSLYCVPLKDVFVKNRNYYPNSESCDNIDVFKVIGNLITDETHKQRTIKKVDFICENFDRLMMLKNHSGDAYDKIRGINQFTFQLYPMFESQHYSKCMNLLAKRILTRFGNISKNLDLHRTKLTFETVSEMKSIFHPNLEGIYFDYYSSIIINIDVKDIENHDHDHVSSSLKSIAFSTVMVQARHGAPTCIDTLNEFDKMGIRQTIKQYILHWQAPYTFGTHVVLDIGEAIDAFDKIFFQDYDKHPLLETIIIKFKDDKYLIGLVRLLIYFYDHYKQLFVERKLYLTHFQTVEIQIDSIWPKTDVLERYPHATNNPQFFEQERNKEYLVDDKNIEIQSSEMTPNSETFGIIYQNIFYWLQRMKEKSCKITFRIQ